MDWNVFRETLICFFVFFIWQRVWAIYKVLLDIRKLLDRE